jgi:hypothetical protein
MGRPSRAMFAALVISFVSVACPSSTVATIESPASDHLLLSPNPAIGSDRIPKMRPLKYLTTQDGLEIDLDGVHFVASASALPVGRGWGVRVTTSVKAQHGKSYKLLTPRRGPFGFSGSLVRGTQTTHLSDAQDGTGTTEVKEQPIEFFRDWPGDSGEKPLGQGDKLSLDVDLWGASGNTYDDLRPVKQLFVVRVSPSSKGKVDVQVEVPTVE